MDEENRYSTRDMKVEEETKEETMKRLPIIGIQYSQAFLWGGLIFIFIGLIFLNPRAILIGMLAIAVRIAYIF